MQGEKSNDEKIQLEMKINELTEELEQKNTTHALLSAQLKRLQVKLRQIQFLFRNVRVNLKKVRGPQSSSALAQFMDPGVCNKCGLCHIKSSSC